MINLNEKEIGVVVAVARNGVIGKENGLAWRLPADLRHFKRITMGHTLIMGRKTYQSIGRPLPGRRTIVVSRQGVRDDFAGCLVARSIDEALELAAGDDKVFIVGGGQIYQQALKLANNLYLTEVAAEPEGDVYFDYNPAEWEVVWQEDHSADERNGYDYCFKRLIRKAA